jgi:hypothetical protein
MLRELLLKIAALPSMITATKNILFYAHICCCTSVTCNGNCVSTSSPEYEGILYPPTYIMSSHLSLSFRFSHQNPVQNPFLRIQLQFKCDLEQNTFWKLTLESKVNLRKHYLIFAQSGDITLQHSGDEMVTLAGLLIKQEWPNML